MKKKCKRDPPVKSKIFFFAEVTGVDFSGSSAFWIEVRFDRFRIPHTDGKQEKK